MKHIWILGVLLSLVMTAPAYADINEDLVEAAKKGDTIKVQVLLGQGADVNATAKYGWTSLLWAVVNGHIEIVKLLIEKGADVNHKNELDWNALEYARLKRRNRILGLAP
jgi:ankyrin repeat protein